MSTSTDEPTTWLRGAERRLADGLARRQLASATASASATRAPRRSPAMSRLLVLLVAAPVHLVTVGSAIGGVYLIVAGSTWPLKGLGAVLLAITYATFPRTNRLHKNSLVLTAEQAPQLFALLGDVALVADGPVPDLVRVSSRFNASAERVGWRRRPVLEIGAALWVTEGPQERVATLGHELGHFAHGDLTEGWWVWTALQSLNHWAHIVAGPRHVLYVDNSMAVRMLAPFQAVVAGYQWLIYTLNGPASQRAEYLADVTSAQAGGTDAAIRSLENLLLYPTVETAMTRAAVSPARPDLWETVRTSVGNVDDGARQRARSAQAEVARIDDRHPLTVLRIQLMESMPYTSAAVVMDRSRTAAIDAELAGHLATTARWAGERIRYRR